MSGSEFFYTEKGKKQDADLHETILAGGVDDRKDQVARAERLGLSREEIEMMYPK